MSRVDNQIKVNKVQNSENIPTNFSKSDFYNYLQGDEGRSFIAGRKEKSAVLEPVLRKEPFVTFE